MRRRPRHETHIDILFVDHVSRTKRRSAANRKNTAGKQYGDRQLSKVEVRFHCHDCSEDLVSEEICFIAPRLSEAAASEACARGCVQSRFRNGCAPFRAR